MTEENKLPTLESLTESIARSILAELADRPFYAVAEMILAARKRHTI